jgi:hypothetical protein
MKRFLIALMLLTTAAWASAPSTLDFTRRAISTLPTFKEDVDYADKAIQLEAIAVAIADRSKAPPAGISPKQWAALMITVAYSESGLSERIVRHACKPRECDSGRAKGLGQLHANTLNRDEWQRADGDVALQVKMLDDGLRRAFWTCSRSGATWVVGALNAYGGVRCGATWPGLDKRVATFNGLVSR